jgi:hypothetical protein
MVKRVILGSLLVMLLSMVVVLMMGTAAFAGTPFTALTGPPPASCAAHCATDPGDPGHGVSAYAKLMGRSNDMWIAQMGICGGDWSASSCCSGWWDKFIE